jgi:stearoyl-CoA 9-desaturase NADPH oxidoreductase
MATTHADEEIVSPSATTPCPTAPPRSRRLGQRLLESGFLNLLAGPPGVDGYLEQVRPTWAVGDCRGEVTSVDRQTPDSVTLGLRANLAWEGFRAGQFVAVSVEIDGAWRSRCYSPACAAGTGRELEITVKAHPKGLVSNFLVESARPGMVLGLAQADGDFVLPDPRPERLLLISGGSGITPVISMLRTLCAEGHSGSVCFLHYAPDPARAIYRGDLERIALGHPEVRLARSYTRAPGEAELDGHFDLSHVRRLEPELGHIETFACGPPALLDAVRDAWANAGVEDRLHIESFIPPTLAPAGDAPEGEIHFAASGVRVENSGAPVLEQAEAAGLSPEFGCRMGICHTCSCRKTAGTVKNLSTGERSTTDEEEIQICVSAPVGDIVVEI